MLPILWRYIIAIYTKIFFLSVTTFVSVLIVSRFKEIARFAALSGNWGITGLYALYQIPFILPMAIPLSALIASILLFQTLSRTHELTAFRTLGFNFKTILTPVLLLASLLSCLNFVISAEVAPFCRRAAQTLLYQETSDNPLVLIQRQNLIKMKDAYMRIRTNDKETRARNFILVTYNDSNERLNLISAKKLKMDEGSLWGQDVAIVSHIHSNDFQFDPLILENQGTLHTNTPFFSAVLKKNRPRIDSPSLSLRMLLHRLHEKPKFMRSAFVDILRRSSLSFAVFSFTFLGCAFGIEQGRSPRKWALLYALLFAFAILASYFLGKSFKKEPWLAALTFPLPHLAALIASTYRLVRLSRGAT